MTASDYASAALSDLALGPMLTERARNVLTGVVRRAMLEERGECAKRAAIAIAGGEHGDDIVCAIHNGPMP